MKKTIITLMLVAVFVICSESVVYADSVSYGADVTQIKCTGVYHSGQANVGKSKAIRIYATEVHQTTGQTYHFTKTGNGSPNTLEMTYSVDKDLGYRFTKASFYYILSGSIKNSILNVLAS